MRSVIFRFEAGYSLQAGQLCLLISFRRRHDRGIFSRIKRKTLKMAARKAGKNKAFQAAKIFGLFPLDTRDLNLNDFRQLWMIPDQKIQGLSTKRDGRRQERCRRRDRRYRRSRRRGQVQRGQKGRRATAATSRRLCHLWDNCCSSTHPLLSRNPSGHTFLLRPN